MYWYVLIPARPGYAALLLDSLLQFCQADIAVLETSASNNSNASSSMFQSSLGPAPDSRARADPLIGCAGFSGGAAAAFAAGASGGAGSAEGARRRRKGT